ncbi:MAG: hypothetical protein II817_00280 [Bacteroidales bacterium]|nr:hypothetical protein [Bacteroidales bacterium]
MKKNILTISKSLICTICFLVIILTGCKKEDSAIFQTHISDKNNTLSPSEDMTTDKAIDTPITIIIEGTPHYYNHEQPSGGLEVTMRCEAPYDRTCYYIEIQHRNQSQNFIRIDYPTNNEILPADTDIPIKNVKFIDESKSIVSFEVIK